MAFNKTTLQKSIENVFKAMTDGNTDTFSNGISNAIVSFVLTGQVKTNDAGTVPGGVYTGGQGNGTLTVTPSSCASILKNALNRMKNMTSGGDNYLAEEMGQGIKKMADEGKVVTVVTGGVLQPPGSVPPVPGYGGPAQGTILCIEAPLVAKLKSVFQKMYNSREQSGFDGNKEFAKELADAVNTFYTSGQITTQGQGNITGSVGAGTIA